MQYSATAIKGVQNDIFHQFFSDSTYNSYKKEPFYLLFDLYSLYYPLHPHFTSIILNSMPCFSISLLSLSLSFSHACTYIRSSSLFLSTPIVPVLLFCCSLPHPHPFPTLSYLPQLICTIGQSITSISTIHFFIYPQLYPISPFTDYHPS